MLAELRKYGIKVNDDDFAVPATPVQQTAQRVSQMSELEREIGAAEKAVDIVKNTVRGLERHLELLKNGWPGSFKPPHVEMKITHVERDLLIARTKLEESRSELQALYARRGK